MKEYMIEVKPWMTLKSSDGFDFMKKFNNDNPMPLVIMYTSGKLAETKGMVKMTLHGDIKQRITQRCMACGRPITNKVSQFFGIGPICGGHNYVSPFDTEKELNTAIASYREKLVNTIWTGMIAKSAITSIQDDKGKEISLEDLPMLGEPSKSAPSTKIHARIDTPVKGTDDFSAFINFEYNAKIVSIIKDVVPSNRRSYDRDTQTWEIDYSILAELQEALSRFEWEVENEEIVPEAIDIDTLKYQFKTLPTEYQLEGVKYGLDRSRFLLGDDQGLGKTKQIIDLALIRKEALGFKHCLIVACVNSLKWNWIKEIEKHSNETGFIIGQYMMPRRKKLAIGSNADKLAHLNQLGTGAEIDSSYFLITNIESLRNAEIAAKLKELCDNHIIDMVAADEVHRCFDYDSLVCTDTGMLKIGDIVTQKLSVNVASYNLDTCDVEYKPIVSWFKNEVNEALVELAISTSTGVKTIKCTGSHKFYTNNRGWVRADNLMPEDDIAEIF